MQAWACAPTEGKKFLQLRKVPHDILPPMPETAARDKRKKESREHIRIEPAIRHALDDFKTN